MPLTADDLAILRRELSELPTTRPRTVTKQRPIAEPAAARAQHRGYTVEDLAQLLGGQGTRDVAGHVARISPAQPEEAARRKAWSGGEPAVDRTTIEESGRETAPGKNASDARPPPSKDGGGPLMRRDGLERPQPKT